MNETEYFELVDAVLVENERSALEPESRQRQIIKVEHTDRVLQILAGPGSGKTEMVVWRVLYELFVNGTDSERVMVTTFTKKAALELTVRIVERSDALIRHALANGVSFSDPRVHNLRVGTLHSLCDSLLSEFDDQYRADGTMLIDENEAAVRMAKAGRFALTNSQVINRGRPLFTELQSVDELVALFRPPWMPPNRWPVRAMQRVQFLMALIGQQTETWWPRCSDVPTPNGVEAVHGVAGLTDELERAREGWRQYLDQQQILDFTTIQQLFRERQDGFVDKLSHIFVDEFQDTNPIQFEIHTRWLINPNTKLTVVGDDDQSVYRFRGSDIHCFNQLEPFCRSNNVSYRRVDLEENYRSTKNIVLYSQAFKAATVLGNPAISMNKIVRPAPNAVDGQKIRMVTGPWAELCQLVATELTAKGIGQLPAPNAPKAETAAILMFSTSEKTDRPADTLRQTCEASPHLRRIYNPRNKTASDPDSPIVQLFALLSYLIDPVSMAPVGANGRNVQVWAANSDPVKNSEATSAPPPFNVADDHASIQKRFIRDNGGRVGTPSGSYSPLFDYLDRIRSALVTATSGGNQPRLTITGLVARLLSFDFFRQSGFTANLFRQAMFTQLMEANVAPTRLSRKSLDNSMDGVTLNSNGKVEWPDEYWSFLGVMGGLLSNNDMDDEEVDVFAEHAISVLTFHQSKGLEFDHLYVAGTGRNADPHSVLKTKLFSGETPQYMIVDGQPETTDLQVLQLAEADREREVYVAMTRAKKQLTFLHDPNHSSPLMSLNPGILQVFAACPAQPHPQLQNLTVQEWNHE